MAITPSTPRRSKRFQPVTFSPTKRTNKASTSATSGNTIQWIGEPSKSRAIEPNHDLTQEELEAWDKRKQEEPEAEELRTRYYDAFEKRKTTPSKGKKTNQQPNVSKEVYRVGDTILISTYSMLIGRRAPSAAVIASMWETDFVPDKSTSREDRMRVRIHWFLRPTELASIRAKRDYLEDEIYYSVSSSDILTPESIISHCSITTSRPSSKSTTSSPAKRARGYAYVPAVEPVESEESDSDDDQESKHDDHGDSGQTGIALKGKLFRCFHAVDSRRGIFGEFDWETHRERALASGKTTDAGGDVWNVSIEKDVRRRPGPKAVAAVSRRKEVQETNEGDSGGESEDSGEEYEHDSSGSDEDDELPELEASDSEGDEEASIQGSDEEFKRPSRKRKHPGDAATPRKRSRITIAHPTPHSKKALGKRGRKSRTKGDASPSKSPRKRQSAFAMRLPQTYTAQTSQAALEKLPKDPWLRAMHALHVGSRPDGAGALKCRENEFGEILMQVGELIEEGSGGCVYISGVPGTGKTATVHAVVRELKRMAQENEISPFTYVEINGLRIPDPAAAYTLLHEGITGAINSKISAKESLKALTRHFSGTGARGPEGHACVVLMDELDQLVYGHKQDVVYNFFNWPTIRNSKLIVIAVANTMDLPERALEGRVRSRLGMSRINFAPYKREHLIAIVKDRLNSVKVPDDPAASKDVLAVDSINLAAMKVGNISGDARRMLDVCRRAVEIASLDKRAAKASDIHEVMRIMQNSPTATFLRDCTFSERVMLASLMKCIKREGVEAIPWADVQYQHALYIPVLTMANTARQLTAYEFKTVLDSLIASRALLLEDGIGMARKPDDERKLKLNLDMGEIERVLSEVGGAKWKNIL